MKKIFVFLFNGFSDWEISYVTPEVYKSEEFELIYFSKDGQSVTSMGGLQIKPVKSLAEIDSDEVDMLLLPGGTAWEKQENNEINQLVKEVKSKNKLLAAICAATAYLGQLGLLDDVKHTSNDLNYLKAVAPNYKGEKHYEKSLAVTDNNLITAAGIAPIEFAKEIFKQVKLYDDDNIEKWYQLFKNGIWSE
jgi:putative intracellular protease/amidase